MVEGQRGQFVDIPPRCLVSVAGGLQLMSLGLVNAKKGEIGDGDHAPAWIPIRLAKGVELFKINVTDMSFFAQFAAGSNLELLIDLNKTTWQGPLTGIRGLLAADKQHFQTIVLKGKENNIDCDRGPWIFVTVWARGGAY